MVQCTFIYFYCTPQWLNHPRGQYIVFYRIHAITHSNKYTENSHWLTCTVLFIDIFLYNGRTNDYVMPTLYGDTIFHLSLYDCIIQFFSDVFVFVRPENLPGSIVFPSIFILFIIYSCRFSKSVCVCVCCILCVSKHQNCWHNGPILSLFQMMLIHAHHIDL